MLLPLPSKFLLTQSDQPEWPFLTLYREMEIKCDSQMTCGLLLSEVIRKLQQRGEDVQ